MNQCWSIFDYMSDAESDFFIRSYPKKDETVEEKVKHLKKIHAQRCGIKFKRSKVNK